MNIASEPRERGGEGEAGGRGEEKIEGTGLGASGWKGVSKMRKKKGVR